MRVTQIVSLFLSALALACGPAPLEENSGQSDVSAVTTLRVHYPGSGHSLSVRGSTGNLSWTSGVAATTPDQQTYMVTVSKAKGTLQFKPLLDDQTWSLGPSGALVYLLGSRAALP